jgi:hypothetical protein
MFIIGNYLLYFYNIVFYVLYFNNFTRLNILISIKLSKYEKNDKNIHLVLLYHHFDYY